ncbi:hypothetical protein [Trinickia sp.]|uniref:hypothetical protein n=1 Tax=Trinickia sp. TaxID=2571163 RepID=UPI003F808C6A
MKIVGYCSLWAIVLALLVSMCAILKEGYIGGRSAPDSEVVAGKVAGHVAARPRPPKPTLSASLHAA